MQKWSKHINFKHDLQKKIKSSKSRNGDWKESSKNQNAFSEKKFKCPIKKGLFDCFFFLLMKMTGQKWIKY